MADFFINLPWWNYQKWVNKISTITYLLKEDSSVIMIFTTFFLKGATKTYFYFATIPIENKWVLMKILQI